MYNMLLLYIITIYLFQQCVSKGSSLSRLRLVVEAVEAATGNAGQPTGSDVVLQHGQALVLQIFHLRAVLQPGHLWGMFLRQM